MAQAAAAALACTALSASASIAQTIDSASFPAPKSLGNPATLGRGLQRTMAMLASSTPEHPNTVRILFYGQSISEQDWWRDVAAELKRRFPSANLIIENRALGGFSSQLLVNTAESDLYPFYPDLMIFHVYGSHTDYENIIRRTRQRTTSEVLIQTDHVTSDADLSEETDPSKLRPDGKIWNSFMNYLWLPSVAQQYGCAIVDQRNLWKQYLRDYNLPASKLLKDGVHQNAYGNFLMARLVEPYLVRRESDPIDPLNCATVQTRAVGKDVVWSPRDGKLTATFDGNRVDVVASALASPGTLDVLIDGKRPSEIPELYRFTRALASVGFKWPVVLKIGSEKRLRVETWMMQVTRDPSDAKRIMFTVDGSVTGPDGSGRSDQKFVSNSGRVVILPDDWNVEYSLSLAGIKAPPGKFTVHWNAVPFFKDSFTADDFDGGSVVGGQKTLTLAQGLPNGRHTLEILDRAADGRKSSPISAIIVYRPPVTEDAPRVELRPTGTTANAR